MSNFIQVGENVPGDYRFLPVGTVIGNERRDQFEKVEPGVWQDLPAASRRYRDADFAGSTYRVRRYPDGYTPDRMTTADFMWRFRNHTITQQAAHGVNQGATLNGLREMGCDMAS